MRSVAVMFRDEGGGREFHASPSQAVAKHRAQTSCLKGRRDLVLLFRNVARAFHYKGGESQLGSLVLAMCIGDAVADNPCAASPRRRSDIYAEAWSPKSAANLPNDEEQQDANDMSLKLYDLCESV